MIKEKNKEQQQICKKKPSGSSNIIKLLLVCHLIIIYYIWIKKKLSFILCVWVTVSTHLMKICHEPEWVELS